MANNIDLAVQRLRQLQQAVFDRKSSPDSLFKEIDSIIQNEMFKASKEINTNYEEISAKLTDLMNGKGNKKRVTAEDVKKAKEE